MGKLLFSYLPIVLLVWLMTRKRSMPSSRALPLVAFITYLIMLVVFRREANMVHAETLSGLLLAWTPILIIAGAVFLFRTMEATGSMDVIRVWLNGISEHPVAQLMIVGWAFPFLIEGASGFGTPAAIAAPIMVGLGFPPVRVAILALVMNTIPVSFGAVGTPTWFGFSSLTLTPEEILEISFRSALINSLAGVMVVFAALMFVIKPAPVLRNWKFILASAGFTVIPHLLVSRVSYEFPSLAGGAIGLVATVFLARTGWGLSGRPVEMHEPAGSSGLRKPEGKRQAGLKGGLLKATFPLWATLLVLVVTRIPQLGIKRLLTLTDPSWDLSLGTLGTFSISPSGVLTLSSIFGTGTGWSHSLFYVPSIIPFFLVSTLTFLLYRGTLPRIRGVFRNTVDQMKKPTLALLGALVFVNLMMMGGEDSAVALIGGNLARLTGGTWKYFASLLGALGSFFSGSATISNLTFAGIQDAIAADLGLNRSTILALQSVGGAMGNMVCINNIVAVASVLALGNLEGFILKRTIRVLLLYAAITALVAVFLP